MNPLEIYRAITRELAEGYQLVFTLKYVGPLPSANKSDGKRSLIKKQIKHAIRRQLHPQLEHVVESDGELSYLMRQLQGYDPEMRRIIHRTPDWTTIGRSLRRGSFVFLPLVLSEAYGTCELIVQFLRREKPGALINGGDLDNRIKTLFDALQIPNEQQLLHSDSPEASETPFYCLLQDDSLITKFCVESKALHTPIASEEEDHVELIIDVTMQFREKAYFNQRINV